MPREIRAKDAILDGELVVLEEAGKPSLSDLLLNREPVVFAAFDLMWLNETASFLSPQPLHSPHRDVRTAGTTVVATNCQRPVRSDGIVMARAR